MDDFYYHCAAITKAQRDDGAEISFLCGKVLKRNGKLVLKGSWDFPKSFIDSGVGSWSGNTKCPECAESADLPLMYLAELEED